MLRALLTKRDLTQLSATDLKRILNLYPPYLGAGIRVVEASPDSRRWSVEMRLYPFNRNYLGTHFGGSLYSMCDPFFLLILSRNLGPNYQVWDEAGTIRFKKPGRGLVRATFELGEGELEAVRADCALHRRSHPTYTAQVLDAGGAVVAEVEKTIYVRRRRGRDSSEQGADGITS